MEGSDDQMNEVEYDIMDQLYFVTSFADVKEQTGFDDAVISSVLWNFMNKGWVKCFDGPEKEVEVEDDDFRRNFAKYHYLASKQGLLAHNVR